MKGHRRGAWVAACAVVLSSVVVASCGSSAKSESRPTTTTRPAPPVELTSSLPPDGERVPLDKPISLSVKNGKLTAVTVSIVPATSDTSASSGITRPAPIGTIADDGLSWQLLGGLAPRTTYAIAAQVTDLNDTSSDHNLRFTTSDPLGELHTNLSVADNGVYGVGMPIIVQLNHPVTPDRRAALTERLTVTTTPQVNGGWRWFSDSEVHWRPEVYWPTGTKVSLKIDFAGFDAGNGIWGVDGRTVSFAIGDAHVSTVDAATHQMVVTNNGQVVRTMAVSTGRDDKYPTKSGIHVVNEKAEKVIMDSATVGIPRDSPDGYYEEVFWNVRISNSGEFVHSAPWSVGSQGNENVSHGCVNASPEDAEWFFNFTQRGDVVEVRGTSEQLDPSNGYGDWQIPYAQWVN